VPPTLRRLFVLLAALVALSAAITGCGLVSRTPPPSGPADFPALTAVLDPLGIRLERIVSGDAGCDDPTLIPTAIGFDASGLDQTSPVRIHLFIFRNRDAFERRRGDVPGCASAFVSDPDTFEQIERSPYVAAGQGPWAPGFEAALRAGLEAAAGTGG
jgi:hypothetical protein